MEKDRDLENNDKLAFPQQAYLNLSGFGRLPLIRQSTSSECGIACLAMIANYYGFRTDISELRRRFPVSMRGTTFKSISEAAHDIGLSGRAIRLEPYELKKLRTPSILHMDFDHFVILKKVRKSHVVIHDPAFGVQKLKMAELDKRLTGVALELSPTEKFMPKPQPTGLTIGKLVRFDRSFFSSFSLGFILSLLVEGLLLVTPFYMQIIVDDVLLKGDLNLLNSIALGFGIVVVFQVIASVIRNLSFQYLGHVLSFDMAARVFHRVMKLPTSYFSTRQLGDMQHRIQSLEQIKHFLVSSAPKIILDSIFSVIVLIILFAYHFSLALLVSISVLIYLLWRLGIFRAMRRAAGDLIIAEAESQTQLLETLRCMPTLKMNTVEIQRESRWRNANARKLNAGLRVGNLDIFDQAFNNVLFQGMRVVVIFIAAKLVFEGEMTIGMITAFIAYYGMFTQRASGLIDLLMDMRLLQVPLTRIADIVLVKPEDMGTNGGRSQDFTGQIELRNVHFAYGKSDLQILRGASICINPGEFVAITGPSGIGKSTILKILACMESPQYGEVLFDGRPVNTWNIYTLREQIGAVFQDDTLLSGSISDNVSLFDEMIDMKRLREVCSDACIADEIEAMPMGYESLVGDMGTSFSGGQRQRLLLARALYRRPKILLLDEATSHLDEENEFKILENIKAMGLTRLVIAHRKETIKAADRVLEVRGGKIFQVYSSDNRVKPTVTS